MRYIKTYEGLFDFLRKKEKVKVTFDDIMECLYDLTDETRIKNELNGDSFDGIFASQDVVFKKRPSLSLDDDADAFMNDELFRDMNFTIRRNSISFDFVYNPNEISDEEVNELLLNCKSKLVIYGCKISFFIGWGQGEGGYNDKEWSDFISMISKTIKKTYSPERRRNITVKIESPAGFN
jgi:hypothetical protein